MLILMIYKFIMNYRFMFLNYDISDGNRFCQNIGRPGAIFDWIIQFVHLYAFEDAQCFLFISLFKFRVLWHGWRKVCSRVPTPALFVFYIDEVYNFLEGFNGHNQIRMHPADREKTMFITQWRVFVAVVMTCSCAPHTLPIDGGRR